MTATHSCIVLAVLVALAMETMQLKIVQLTNDQLTSVRQSALMRHNVYRRQHNVSDYVLDDKINAVAQNYSMQLARINVLRHSYNPRFGENLFQYCQYGVTPTAILLNLTMIASDVFYNEIRFYNYSNPRFAPPYSHFTQLVWKSSSVMGVGVYLSEMLVDRIYNYSCAWIVINYWSPGNLNYISSFRANVLPPLNAQPNEPNTTSTATTTKMTTTSISSTSTKTPTTTISATTRAKTTRARITTLASTTKNVRPTTTTPKPFITTATRTLKP